MREQKERDEMPVPSATMGSVLQPDSRGGPPRFHAKSQRPDLSDKEGERSIVNIRRMSPASISAGRRAFAYSDRFSVG